MQVSLVKLLKNYQWIQLKLKSKAHLQTIIRSGKSEFNLNGLMLKNIHIYHIIEEENLFKLPTDLLKTMIRQTVFAVSTSETRPILTGVNWKVENDELTCIATDSHRLAIKKS